jgi:ABC-type uncharacterized transport system substrate-binding protein
MTISRRRAIGMLAALATAPVARAQRSGTPARIGWLSYLAPPDPALDQLREGLRDLGYTEGAQYVLVPRYASGDFTRLPQLVSELSRERLDVLVTRGPTSDYAMKIRARVPIVFAFSGDPVAAGYAHSLAHPGRNMTGITFMALELSAKRVEVLKETVVNATRVALLSNPEHAGELAEYRVTEEAARKVGMTIDRHLVQSPQELPATLKRIGASRPDAMLVFPDSLTLQRRADIVDFAAKERVPAMYAWTEFVESGGLVSYGPRLVDNYKTLARFVDRVLKGADASAIPIEQVRQIGLTVNLTAARAIGLTFPPSIMLRADRVVG